MTETQTKAQNMSHKGGSVLLRILVVVITLGVLVALGINFFRTPETPLARAQSLIREGKAAAALPILEELCRKEPDNAEVFPAMAQSYLATERFAEGRTALDTSLRLKLSPEALAPVVLSYANYYESRGDFEEADKLFRSAKAVCGDQYLNAGKGQLYHRWGENDIQKSNMKDAVVHLELASQLSSFLDQNAQNDIVRKLANGYRELAAVAEVQDKNDQEARRLLEKSLTVCDELATRIALANIYRREGKKDKAIENYELICKQDANNLEARHQLINLLIETKQLEKAQAALTELTDREKSVENYQLLASLNLKLNNYAGAVRALEDACGLNSKPELLKELHGVLLTWSDVLMRQKKTQEAISVRGHAERISDQLAMLTRDQTPEETPAQTEAPAATGQWDPKVPPIALVFSRIWLARGSLTPEGEIRIKNISGAPVPDLALTAVFYDNTSRRANGSVTLPVATPTSQPFAVGGEKSLYFSCPNIVRYDHQQAVIILWKGKFLREFPVVKNK